MKEMNTVRLGMYGLLFIMLLMAIAGIRGFMQIVPAVEELNFHNADSCRACEQMLLLLPQIESHNVQEKFLEHLKIARNNITEPGEQELVATIMSEYPGVFFHKADKHKLTEAIHALSDANFKAMDAGVRRAKQMSANGAWIIVAMALFVFIAGLQYLKQLNRALIHPMEEIKSVLLDQQDGKTIRRCQENGAPPYARQIFELINKLLDERR